MSESFLGRQRLILLDLNVPDWDERFMSRFDPDAFVNAAVRAGVDGVAIFTNVFGDGACYWPTKSGKMHAGLGGRDIVGEQVELFHRRGIAVCAVYEAIYNNWAFREHPEWRITLAGAARTGHDAPSSRFELCCPNHPEYLEFMLRQLDELATGYSFDGLFLDMLQWPGVCVCDSCRSRYREEEKAELPETMDWCSKDWCRFQAARERWLVDIFRRLRDRVKVSLDVPVFGNAAGIIGNGWVPGCGPELVSLNDLLGGDFHVANLFTPFSAFSRLSSSVIYMNNISGSAGEASQLKSTEELTSNAFATVAFGGSFMAIPAVESDGTIEAAGYERLADVFGTIEPYQPHVGGQPLMDVAVYWSPQADVSFQDNGRPLAKLRGYGLNRPHWSAIEGAVTILREAHLPVGVVTRADLGNLDDFPLIVLPNLLRTDPDELEAFRRYVENGGRLYASGYTSLVTADGTRHDDFLLADLFGCHFAGEESAAVTYLKPVGPEVGAWIAPLRYVAHGAPWPFGADPGTALRITADAQAQPVATTTLPYGEGRGTVDGGWAMALSSPPWEDTSRPAVVRHRFGKGEVVYSAMDVERAGSRLPALPPEYGPSAWDHTGAFFVDLVRSLLPREPRFEAEAHHNVWITAADHPEQSRMRLCFLNRPARFPALPVPVVRFRAAPPEGARFTGLQRIPGGEPIEFSLDANGSLEAEIRDLHLFEMVAAHYTAR
jgi:hypothetical protein